MNNGEKLEQSIGEPIDAKLINGESLARQSELMASCASLDKVKPSVEEWPDESDDDS